MKHQFECCLHNAIQIGDGFELEFARPGNNVNMFRVAKIRTEEFCITVLYCVYIDCIACIIVHRIVCMLCSMQVECDFIAQCSQYC